MEANFYGVDNPELELHIRMVLLDIFGAEDGEGRDIVIAASDGTEFTVHTSKLYRLFRSMFVKGDPIKFSLQGVNFRFWEDEPTTKAFLAFLNTNDKTLMEKSSDVTFKLIKLGRLYGLEDVAAAAQQVLMEKIGTDDKFDGPEFLWTLNAWIVNLTDRNNGDVPSDLVALKSAVSKVFNRNVVNSRKHRIRSPAASHNMFGSFWQMNANLLL